MSRTHRFTPTTRRREEKRDNVIHMVKLRRCKRHDINDDEYDINIRIHV